MELTNSFENSGNLPEAEVPSIKDTNFMQRDLITRSGRDPLEWIKEQSDRFRRLVNSRPELFYGYAKLPEEEKAQRLELAEDMLNAFGREAA